MSTHSDEPAATLPPTEFVTAMTFLSSADAYIARAILAAEGIESWITGDIVSDNLSWYGVAVRRVELMVSEKDAVPAADILRQFDERHRPGARSFAGPQLPWTCAACGESNPFGFEQCWSCGSTESAPEAPAMPTTDAAAVVDSEPPPDDTHWNPYTRPTDPGVESRAAAELPDENRRILRAIVFSTFFPFLAPWAAVLAFRSTKCRSSLRIAIIVWNVALAALLAALFMTG